MSRRSKKKAKPEKAAPTRFNPVASSPGKRNWFFGLLLVFAIIMAYQPAWRAGFIWDDDDYVTGNSLLSAPDGLRRIWFSFDSPSQYFPLTYTVLRMEYALWGLNSTGYHWVNILLHVINALLVWRLLRRLDLSGAWLGAALWALHPVQVESVAWISELKNVLMCFFFLLTLLAWIEFVGEPFRRRWIIYVLALFFYVLALSSKTTACTLPAALLLILWLKSRPINRQRLAQIIPFIVLGIGMGLLTMWWERYHIGTQGKPFAMGVMERILVASRAVWFYLGKLFWPVNLTFSYPRWTISASDPLSYVWLVATVGFGAIIYYTRRYAGRSVEVAALFFVATLSPVLGFFMLYTFLYSFVADHYQYIASLGPIALVSAGIAGWAGFFKRRNLWLEIVLWAGLLLALGTLSWRQARIYRSEETLWVDTLQKNPNSWMAHNNLGNALLQKGNVDEAIVQCQESLQINPDNAQAHNNLGNALLQKGSVDEAITQYQKALQIEPDYAEAHNDLGNALLKKGSVDEAIIQYQRALQIRPDDAEVHINLGDALVKKGNVEGAIIQYQKALQIRPDYAKACYDLGNALVRNGNVDEAMVYYQKALQIKPDYAEALNNLGSALLLKGSVDEAIIHYQRALQIKPDDAEVHMNLGNALLQKGNVDEAIIQYQKALQIKPDYAEVHINLGNVLLQKGRVDEAIIHYQRALQIKPGDAEVHINLGNALVQKGRVDEAIAHYQKALQIKPDDAEACYDLGNALLQKGSVDEAIVHYQRALQIKPDYVEAQNNLAWVLATCPQASLRNGNQAVKLAQLANQLTGDGNPVVLRTLAAAYAEAGRFPEAVGTAQRALQLAGTQSNPALADGIRSQLKLYQAGFPFHLH